MTEAEYEESPQQMPEHFITRDEFASTVESLGELIRDQTRSQTRAMSELRADLKAGAVEARQASRPQWQPVSLAFTVFSVVLGALYGVHNNGEAKVDTLRSQIHAEHLERLEIVEAWQPGHDHEVRGRNATQDEQIAGLRHDLERVTSEIRKRAPFVYGNTEQE